MIYGYARGVDLKTQMDALSAAGAETIFQDTDRRQPELARVLQALRPADTLLVAKPGCLTRSTEEFSAILEAVHQSGAQIRFLPDDSPHSSGFERIDLNTPAGKLLFAVLLATGEREKRRMAEEDTADA